MTLASPAKGYRMTTVFALHRATLRCFWTRASLLDLTITPNTGVRSVTADCALARGATHDHATLIQRVHAGPHLNAAAVIHFHQTAIRNHVAANAAIHHRGSQWLSATLARQRTLPGTSHQPTNPSQHVYPLEIPVHNNTPTT